MTQVTIQQATERLSGLIEAALKGEEIVITQDDTPVVTLTPCVT
jgi:prevent-host-death family protein